MLLWSYRRRPHCACGCDSSLHSSCVVVVVGGGVSVGERSCGAGGAGGCR